MNLGKAMQKHFLLANLTYPVWCNSKIFNPQIYIFNRHCHDFSRKTLNYFVVIDVYNASLRYF